MKTSNLTLLFLSLAYVVAGQIEVPNAPQWQVTFQVVDDVGMPLSGAVVSASYYVPPPPNAREAGSRKTGVTDTNGFITLSAHSGPAIAYGAGKNSYYSTSGLGYKWDPASKTDGKWQPWNPTLSMVLKKVGTPVPMYAKWMNSEPRAFKKSGPGPISFNKSIGYDLEAGDWVIPDGKGTNTDIIFSEYFNKKSSADYDYVLTVSFPNKGDGIQEFSPTPLDKTSEFVSPREAPQEGYLPRLVEETSEHPEQPSKFGTDPNRNYFFRVRTVLDDRGNVRTALYGKIYGDFMQCRYYLNPNPNDRNMEFDPKHNLLPAQNITAP